MSETLLFRLYRGQVEAFRETVESWKVEHHHAMIARSAEDLVRHCLHAPALVKELWRETFAKLRDDGIEDINETRRELWSLIENIQGILGTAREMAHGLEQNGHGLAGMPELEQAIQTVEEQKHFIFEHWGEFTSETVDRALEEHGRGESMELDDAFASIAGVDRTTWLKRVEEHKRKYHGGEQGYSG